MLDVPPLKLAINIFKDALEIKCYSLIILEQCIYHSFVPRPKNILRRLENDIKMVCNINVSQLE